MALITVSRLDLDTFQAFLGESPIWLPLLEAKEDKAEPARFMLVWGENLSDWSLSNKATTMGNDDVIGEGNVAWGGLARTLARSLLLIQSSEPFQAFQACWMST